MRIGEEVYVTNGQGFYGKIIQITEETIGIEDKEEKKHLIPSGEVHSLTPFASHSLVKAIEGMTDTDLYLYTDLGKVRIYTYGFSFIDKFNRGTLQVEVTPRGHWTNVMGLKIEWDYKEEIAESNVEARISGGREYIDLTMNILRELQNLRAILNKDSFESIKKAVIRKEKEFEAKVAKKQAEAKIEFLKTHRLIIDSPKKWLEDFSNEVKANDGEATRTLITFHLCRYGETSIATSLYRGNLTSANRLTFSIEGGIIKKQNVIRDFPDVYEKIV